MRSRLLHSSGRSLEPRAIRLTSFTLQLCFYSTATLSDNWHHYESIQRQSRAFSRVRSKGYSSSLSSVPSPPPSGALVEISSFESSFRISIFEMCVTCFFVFFLCADFKRCDAASHFQSSASAMACFSPVKTDNCR